MRIKLWTLTAALAFATTTAWGQITKDQLYEMTANGLDETTIVSLVERNCVDFEMGGQVVVELASRVSQEVLRTVVDCLRIKEETARKEKAKALAAAAEAAAEGHPATAGAGRVSGVRVKAATEKAFSAPSFVTVQLGSNKSSFSASEIELRLLQVDPSAEKPTELRFRFSGEGDLGKDLRCYRKQEEIRLEPGEYGAYFHVVSYTTRGFRNKRIVRSDLHKFRAEYQGPGPITLEYSAKEESFRSKKGRAIVVHGPVLFFGEEHATVDSEKSLEDLLGMFGG